MVDAKFDRRTEIVNPRIERVILLGIGRDRRVDMDEFEPLEKIVVRLRFEQRVPPPTGSGK